MNPLHHQLGFFLARMAVTFGATDRHDLFANAVIETGGDFTVPRPGDSWGSHLVELSLFGIHESGDCVETALANWIDRARDQFDRLCALSGAEVMVMGDITGLSDADLRAACLTVSLNSNDLDALARARTIAAALDAGMAA